MILVLGLVLLVFSRSIDSLGCGHRPPGFRVIGGETAAPNSWPWQVSVAFSSWHVCGGSILAPKWVLTSAHCLSDYPFPEMYKAVVGAHKLYGSTPFQQILKVKKLHIHKQYNPQTMKNDIALLELQTPIMFNDKVNTICLPRTTDGPPSRSRKCYVTGWGRTMADGESAVFLQEAQLRIVSHNVCFRRNLAIHPVDKKTMICAGLDKERGGCHGDSGGPLVCEESRRWLLRGVVSWGRGDCSPKYYTVFARVRTYVPWIRDIMAGGDGVGIGGGCNKKDNEMCPHFQSLCSVNAAVRKLCPNMCKSCKEAEDKEECKEIPNVCFSADWKARCHEDLVQRLCSKVCTNIC